MSIPTISNEIRYTTLILEPLVLLLTISNNPAKEDNCELMREIIIKVDAAETGRALEVVKKIAIRTEVNEERNAIIAYINAKVGENNLLASDAELFNIIGFPIDDISDHNAI